MTSPTEYLDNIIKVRRIQTLIVVAVIFLAGLFFGAYRLPVKFETIEAQVIKYIGHKENHPSYKAVVKLKSGQDVFVFFNNSSQIKVGSKLLVEKRTSLLGKTSYHPIRVID